jgi:hypothetical protein
MKKSTLNVITLALVLINLVLTVILTFSLVSTNNKTNKLISKVAEIIDLDVAGADTGDKGTGLDDITYVDVTNNDSKDIMISYTDGGKTHYAIMNVSLGLNTKAKDYTAKSTTINNGMKVIVNAVQTEAMKYTYSTVASSKATIESALLEQLQDTFQTQCITSVIVSIVVQ